LKNYSELCERILSEGVSRQDRTGVGTISVFGAQLRFNLQDGFPLLTLKKTNFQSIAHELIWLISGSTNIKYLKENGVNIWDEWADENGDLGPVYGEQWREWHVCYNDEFQLDETVVDQLANVIEGIKTNPTSRRHMVNAWNVSQIESMALPPCHYCFQFYVAEGKLSCIFNMRSTDVALGLPYNIASYALLTHMIASICGLEVGELIYSGADVHIYNNQIDAVKKMLKRDSFTLPKLNINKNITDIDDFSIDDFSLEGYNCHPFIKIPVAV
jgi:thymidylate synthase